MSRPSYSAGVFEVFCPGDGTRYEMGLLDTGERNEVVLTVMLSGKGVSALVPRDMILSEDYLASKMPNQNPYTIKAACCWAGKQGIDVLYEKPEGINDYGERDKDGYRKGGSYR